MKIAVFALNHGRICIFARLILERMEHPEILPIAANGEIQGCPPLAGVVKDQYHAAVTESHSIDAGIRAG